MSECQWFVNHSQEMFYSFPAFWLMGKQDIVRGGKSHAAPGRRVSAACPHYKDGGSDRQIVPPTYFLCSSSFHSLTHFLPSWLPASSPRNRLTFRGTCTWSFAQWRFSPPLPPLSLWEQAHTYFHSFYLLTEKARMGEQVGKKLNLAETLRENEFHRLLQFQIPGLLVPKSARRAQALPPRCIESRGPLWENRGETHHFLCNYQRKIHAGPT